MKKKLGGFTRIYLVLSVVWIVVFGYMTVTSSLLELYKNAFVWIFVLLPIPAYFLFKWIVTGFKK